MTLPRNPAAFLCLGAAALILLGRPVRSAEPVLDTMQRELDRSVGILSQQPTPLYFLSYEITEQRTAYLRASFGSITGRSSTVSRILDIDLRVGDYDLDNTHPVRGRSAQRPRRGARGEVPISDRDALRTTLWFQTDRKYKDAIEQLTKVKTNVQVKVQDEDRAPDFSVDSPEQFVEDLVPLAIDLSAWEKRLERFSAPFGRARHVFAADATLTVSAVTRWYANSEGALIRTAEPSARLSVSARTKAQDGMELPRSERFFAFRPDDLPDDDVVLEKVDAMIRDLEALRTAPVADPYTGPAILSGRASGVFFHEILGHRVEGHRQRSESDAQTFKEMLGEQVLPEAFSVIFDPTVRSVSSTDLAGSYRFDNQGVRARRVSVIDRGVLRRFLMSRTPIPGFSRSNGHGRKQAGYAPVSRQSNLFVEVSETHSSEALKEMLIARLAEANQPYGLYFQDVRGGFTTTRRTEPNAFNVDPVMVYRVYADGREELVRGVDLIGTPLTTFSKVAAAGGEIGVFNGTCGAESGGVPVSAASPALLVSQIEVQREAKSQERLPLLPPPEALPQTLQPLGWGVD